GGSASRECRRWTDLEFLAKPCLVYASRGARPRISISCAPGACEARSRREEETMPVRIGDDEQRRDRPQPPGALWVPAACGRLRCWRSSMMLSVIACVAPPCIWPHRTRNATDDNSRTGS